MSRKNVTDMMQNEGSVDPSKLNDDELRYARDRYLITQEQFDESMDRDKPLDKWTGKQLQAYAEELQIDTSEVKDRKGLIAAIEAHVSAGAAPVATGA